MTKKDKIIEQQAALIKQLTETNKQYEMIIKALTERVAELERRLELNSSNSSKPPSTDVFNKPTVVTLRERGVNKFGGQIGHKGNNLKQVANPEKTENYALDVCEYCQASLSDEPLENIITRQEIDVEVRRHATEHRAEVKICKCCKRKNIAKFPKHVKAPVQYGQNLQAFVVYLSHQFVAKDRLSKTFADLFGIPLSDTTIMNIEKNCAKNLVSFHNHVYEYLKKALLKHLDETGFRVMGKLYWLHVLSNIIATYYCVNKKRGFLHEGVEGITIHDHWKSYFKMVGVEHGLCNAHHLRELKGLHQFENESWAKKMMQLLLLMSRLENPSDAIKARCENLYDSCVQEGLEFHESQDPLSKRKKRKGYNLAIRLRDYKNETLRFFRDAKTPFTNNQAEQDVRNMKTKQKVSGGFRTDDGAKDFAIVRSYISTMGKLGVNLFDALIDAVRDTVCLPTFGVAW